MYIDEATMENSVDIPQNLKMEWLKQDKSLFL